MKLIAKIYGIVLLLIIYSGWFVNIPDWNDGLYSDLHSGVRWLKILGTVILTIGALGIFGFFDIHKVFNNWRANNTPDHPTKGDANEMIVIGVWFAFTAVGIALIAGG